jgi:flagellar hook-associated protein FlgK
MFPRHRGLFVQLLAFLRNQYKQLTGLDGKLRKATGAIDADINEIAADIAALEKQIAQAKARLN